MLLLRLRLLYIYHSGFPSTDTKIISSPDVGTSVIIPTAYIIIIILILNIIIIYLFINLFLTATYIWQIKKRMEQNGSEENVE